MSPHPAKPGPASGAPADETTAIAAMRSELGRIREGVGRIERGLVEIERRAASRPIRPRPERYFRVLLAVYEHGRHGMGSDAFGALGAEHGYDRRGLGGFFTGARAALRQDGGRVVLTAEGKRLLDHHLDSVT